jgi:hypothetical protein
LLVSRPSPSLPASFSEYNLVLIRDKIMDVSAVQAMLPKTGQAACGEEAEDMDARFPSPPPSRTPAASAPSVEDISFDANPVFPSTTTPALWLNQDSWEGMIDLVPRTSGHGSCSFIKDRLVQ